MTRQVPKDGSAIRLVAVPNNRKQDKQGKAIASPVRIVRLGHIDAPCVVCYLKAARLALAGRPATDGGASILRLYDLKRHKQKRSCSLHR